MSQQTRTGVVGVLIGMVVTILISIIVVTSLITSGNQMGVNEGAGATVWNALIDNIWIAFSLLVILPIVIGAVALLRYLGVLGG